MMADVQDLHGFAEQARGEGPVAPAMWGGSPFSAPLGNALPGPGTASLGQTLRVLGPVHRGEVLRHVTKGDGGLRTGRRISHAYVLDVPAHEGLVIISDAAIVILPDLTTKADISQSAIDLAHAIGLPQPRVGILSAVETGNQPIPSTLDAAILSRMAERGQIRGGLVEGPLATDNAGDAAAARTKGISSMVAGPADAAEARMISAALAVLYPWRRTGASPRAEAAP
jgi:hypothetical protein